MAGLGDFGKQVFRNRTIYRILFSWKIQEHCSDIAGDILDIGGGKNPTYRQYLSKDVQLLRAEPSKEKNPDVVLDMNSPKWELERTFSTIFCHNTLYIAHDPVKVLQNMHEALSTKGTLYLTTPFIFRESPEPDDLHRFTRQKLELMLKQSGFDNVVIEPFGNNFSSALYLVYPFLYFRVVKYIAYGLGLLCDRLVPKGMSVPLGYFVIVKKV